MSGILKTVLLLFFFAIPDMAFAQSESAYTKAGDEAMLRKNPVAATAFYIEALEYNPESVILTQKTAAAWKARFNYKNALAWYRKSLSLDKLTNEQVVTALVQIYDLQKRMEDYSAAEYTYGQVPDRIIADSLLRDYSMVLMNAHHPAKEIQLGDEINTGYSDFAPQMLGDTTLMFSSNRFKALKTGNASSKIMRASKKGQKFTMSEPMPGSMNPYGKHTANASVSQDGKIMIYTICEEDENNIITCQLYESVRQGAAWSAGILMPDSNININGTSSTQPCITTNREKGYVLYYASNRKNSKGGYDIWMSERDPNGKYTPSVSLKYVNTTADEMTPWYDAYSDTLYFSSLRTGSFGGLDIWKIKLNDSLIINCGTPFNSGYDDLYPNILSPDTIITEIRKSYIVSNRPPSKTFKGETCCYDIFYIEPVITKHDSVIAVKPPEKIITDTLAYVKQKDESLKTLLPLRLYFDNDYPDPKSRSSTTTSSFSSLAYAYLDKSAQFIDANEGAEKEAITTFFRDSVTGSVERLRTFSEGLAEMITLGYKVEITLQGSASPLADSRYNVILSERRIHSLLNEWEQSGPSLLRSSINNGDITIIREAAGESLADQKVTDRADRINESVYGEKASKLRRIEITSLTLRK